MLTRRRTADLLAGWSGWIIVAAVMFSAIGAVPRIVPWWQRVLLSLAIAAQLLPLFAVMGLPWPVPRVRFWIAVWATVFFLSDLSQLLASQFGQNLWLFVISNPIQDAALLMAFSYWQVTPAARRAMRIAIPLLAVATLAIVVTKDEVNTFKVVSTPFRLLIITTIVTYTLILRTSRERDRIWERDWLWTSLGVMLYYAAYVVVDPVSAALLPERPDLARLVYVVKGAVDTVAYLMVWKGMRCPVDQASSASTSEPYSLLPSS